MFLYYCFCVKNAGQRLREEADMDNPCKLSGATRGSNTSLPFPNPVVG